MKAEPWPFDQPPECAAFSLRDIIFGGKPILYVSHDEDDHGWQFLDGTECANRPATDAAIVRLDEVVLLDRSILELADLPPGWIATRRSANAVWEREPR